MSKKNKNIFIQGPIPPALIADSIQKHASKTDIGAHQIFLGQVRRDVHENKFVAGIEYTAFEELVLEKMHRIREGIFDKYPISCMHIYHSLGLVAAGELCLFVFLSSPHRHAATQACAEVVELIKRELPIWGKERFEDESYQWKENQ